MHRFIFLATFLPAVFLMDLLASSASIPEEPLAVSVQIAARLSHENSLRALETRLTSPLTPVRKSNEELVCENEVFAFMLDHIRGLEPGDKWVDDRIQDKGIANCREIFEITDWVDLDGNGKMELIIQTDVAFWATGRSDRRTWVVRVTKDGYEVMLDAGFVMVITPEMKRVGNHSVLTVNRHAGGDSFVIASYEYRDDGYRLSKCTSYRLGDRDAQRTELGFCE